MFSDYLTEAGVDPASRNELLADLERWSRSYALTTLENLGWRREKGVVVDVEELRKRLDVEDEHQRLFRRLFEMLASSGVVEEKGDGFVVLLGADDPIAGRACRRSLRSSMLGWPSVLTRLDRSGVVPAFWCRAG